MTDKPCPSRSDQNAYRRWLYRNSPAYRLARLNHSRRRHGYSPLASLDDAVQGRLPKPQIRV